MAGDLTLYRRRCSLPTSHFGPLLETLLFRFFVFWCQPAIFYEYRAQKT